MVFNYMSKGSLDGALLNPPSGRVLSWCKRCDILRGLAAALEYLHFEASEEEAIIHRDVKPANVLLDEDFNAILCDFGLARWASKYSDPKSTAVAGTYGYIAPEAALTRKFTAKTDVYAFGAVVLETVCGRKALDFKLSDENERLLVDWVWKKYSKNELVSVVDSRLDNRTGIESQTTRVLKLGLLCSHPEAKRRPDMRQVKRILDNEKEAMPKVPREKPRFSRSYWLTNWLPPFVNRLTFS